jgi:phospholipid/cholesterol/gamma-HCH transport system substrate-binding protein
VDNAGGAYPFSTGQPNYREFFYSVVGLAGESQNFDGNGPYVRFQAGGGPQLVHMPEPNGGFQAHSYWAHNISAPLGTRPRLPAAGMPPFRMDVPCYKQAVPDLNGPAAAIGPPDPKP